MNTRKPVELHTGHHTKAELQQMERENERAKTSRRTLFRGTPSELIDERAVREWKRVVKILREIDVIGDLDLSNIVGYCNAFALYCKASDELKTEPMVIETDKGKIKNPLIAIQDLYAKQMRDFATKAGLTVDTRLKAAAVAVKKDDSSMISEEFGDI